MFPYLVFLSTIFALMFPFSHTTCDQLLASVNQYCETQRGGTVHAIPSRGKAGPKGEPGSVSYDAINATIVKMFQEQTESMMIAIEEKVKQRSLQLIERSEARYREIQRELQELRRQREFPEGWYKAGNGLLYQFSNSRKSWHQANAHCRSRGAIPASSGIRNSTIRRAIVALAGKERFWFGLTDIAREGYWSWEDGISASTSDPIWWSGEPNDHNGSEDCAYLFWGSGSWFANDSPCETDMVAFICEKRP